MHNSHRLKVISRVLSQELTCDMITISGSSSTAAEDVWSKVVNLLAVFVSNDWATCCSCICTQSNSILS